MSISFVINNELVEITVPDVSSRTRLINDDTFTIMYLKNCIRTGKIILPEPIKLISRRISDTEEELVYTAEPLEHVKVNTYYNEEERVDDVEDRDNEEERMHTNEEERMDNTENRDNRISDDDSENYLLNHVPTPPPPPPKSSQRRASELWAENHTKLILDNFHSYLSGIGPMKRFKTKKHMWEQIAKDLFAIHNISKSALQVENRYKTIVRRKKNAIVNNSQTGRSRQTVPFADEMNKIASLDDSIAPQVIRSAKSVRTFKEPAEDDDSQSDDEVCNLKRKNDRSTLMLMNKKIKTRKNSSIGETLIKLQKEREASRERRHKEKLELIREIFGKQ